MFEHYYEWFLKQSNPVKAGVVISTIIIIILVISLVVGIVFPDDSPLTGTALENYKASCTVLSFQELNGNTNDYMGKHIRMNGQITQIYVNNGVTDIFLEVSASSGGGYPSDIVFVTYKNKTSFKVGDLVTVYGNVAGTYNYFSTTSKVLVPKIIARDIEILSNSVSVVPVPFSNPENNTNISNTALNNSTSTVTSTTPTTTQQHIDPTNSSAPL